MAAFILFVILSYLLGAIHTAVVVGKILGIDVLRGGSSNPGATNITRLSGKRSWGIFVLTIDALKGYIPARFGAMILTAFQMFPDQLDPWTVRVILGSAAILGHTTSVWLKFHGGKGVATSLGVVFALSPGIGLICFVLWAILAEITVRISVSSLLAGLAFPLLLLLRSEVPPAVTTFAWILPLFLLFTHRQNLIRLLWGDEPRIEREKMVRYLFAKYGWRNGSKS